MKLCETGKYIKYLMALHNVKVYELAEALELSEPTLRSRLKDGNFKHDEMRVLINILKIENPEDVFFKTGVSPRGTREEKAAIK